MVFNCRRRRLERLLREREERVRRYSLAVKQADAREKLGGRALIPAHGKSSFMYRPF